MILACLLSLLMLFPAPLWAGYLFNGNDHIDGNNTASNIDISTFSWSCWVKFDTLPGASTPQQIITHAAAIAGGNFRLSMEVAEVGGSDVFRFGEGFSGQAFSLWIVPAATFTFSSTGVWYQIGADYDSVAANDPVLVINGVSRTISEIATPSGSRLTGTDSIRLGEDLAGTGDVLGTVAECGFWNRRLTSGEWTNLGVDKYAPSMIDSGLVYYLPMISDAVDPKGNTGTLTVTGATIGDHPPDMVYPGGTVCRRMLLGAGC